MEEKRSVYSSCESLPGHQLVLSSVAIDFFIFFAIQFMNFIDLYFSTLIEVYLTTLCLLTNFSKLLKL